MSQITATHLPDTDTSWGAGEVRHWKLSEPVAYGWGDEPDGHTEFVVTSAADVMMSGPEAYIFPADADGKVIDWGEMEGSGKGDHDHEAAIRRAGWEVAS